MNDEWEAMLETLKGCGLNLGDDCNPMNVGERLLLIVPALESAGKLPRPPKAKGERDGEDLDDDEDSEDRELLRAERAGGGRREAADRLALSLSPRPSPAARARDSATLTAWDKTPGW